MALGSRVVHVFEHSLAVRKLARAVQSPVAASARGDGDCRDVARSIALRELDRRRAARGRLWRDSRGPWLGLFGTFDERRQIEHRDIGRGDLSRGERKSKEWELHL